MHKGFIIIGLTPPEIVIDESQRIRNLLDSGRIDILHLRHPGASISAVENVLEEIPRSLLNRITLHTHTELISRYPVGGVHEKAGYKTVLTFQETLAEDKYSGKGTGTDNKIRRSRSCHSLDEISGSTKCDYLFLSPIFDSISKEGYRSSFPKEKWPELSEFLNKTNMPVIALGGVTEDKIPILKDLGFSGAAMLGALWSKTG